MRHGTARLDTAGHDAEQPPGMLTGSQIRAARALLGWTAQAVADKAGISWHTVQRAETAPGVPNVNARTLAAIQSALEKAGVVFLDPGDTRDGGPGVRLRR